MTLLLLAGTGESRVLATQLARQKVDVIASLAGATRQPARLDVPTRSGGFGGRDGFVDYLASAGITAVLDATHPFAARISHRTATVCAELGLPYMQLLRPEWQPEAGDNWIFLDREAQAAEHIAKGATVFLATGLQNLSDFANLIGRRVICRRIDQPQDPFPFPGGEYLMGRPPFSIEDEIKLFQNLGVDWLVVKNSGGAASRSKLDAARALGIRVALLRRPVQPNGQKVTTVADALDWVASL